MPGHLKQGGETVEKGEFSDQEVETQASCWKEPVGSMFTVTVTIKSNIRGICWEPGSAQSPHSRTFHGSAGSCSISSPYLGPLRLRSPEMSLTLRAVPTPPHSLECFEDHLMTPAQMIMTVFREYF